MRLEPIVNRILTEDVRQARLPHGLQLFVGVKPQHARTFAVIGTEYGSIDSAFSVDGEERQVPDGVAHFLEHKLFEKPEGDVSELFHRRGADTNAATSYANTSYLFTCTDGFEPNLDLLVDFVLVPHFSAEGVAKEQGIIAQEIKMYQDHADYRLYTNLLGALFARHPVRIDIAGTIESISEIDPETLYTCHRTFYHPSNMALVVVGPVDPDEVADRVAAQLERIGFGPPPSVERRLPVEPLEPAAREVVERREVARPRVALGFKGLPPTSVTGPDALRANVAFAIGLDLALGRSSAAHARLYEEGVIDESFSFSQASERGFAFAVLGGESDEPESFRKALLDVLADSLSGGLDKKAFARARDRYLGSYIRSFDSVESCAQTYLSAHFRKVSPFAVYEAVESLNLDELESVFRERIRPEDCVTSLILPPES